MPRRCRGGSGRRAPVRARRHGCQPGRALPPRLLDEITRRAPRACVLVSGYPSLFGGTCGAGGCLVGQISLPGGSGQVDAVVGDQDARWLNGVVTRLDGVLREATAGRAQVRYADVAAIFAGHGLRDEGVPWVLPPPERWGPTAGSAR